MKNTISSRLERRSGKPQCRSARTKFHGSHVASVGREAFEAIADEPVFRERQGPSGATQVTFRDVLEPIAAGDKRRRIRFGAGLLDHVVAALQARGFEVRVAHPIPWPWVGGRPAEPRCEFLVRAYGRWGSLAIVPNPADRIRIVAELCSLHPESNVLVVVKNNIEVTAIAKALKSSTRRVVSCTPAIPNSHPWLHVISSGGLSSCSCMYWNVILFMDAELALSATAEEYLGSFIGAAFIGFLVRDYRHLLPTERCTLEAKFGPVIYSPGDDTIKTEVRVASLQPTTVPISAGGILDYKRHNVWTNLARNQLIARAAQSLSEGDLTALKELGLLEAASWLNETGQRPTVAVIVENVEHGQQLAGLLADWRLEPAGYMPASGCMVQHDRVIITLARATETVIATNVVVVAHGGTDCLPDATQLTTDAWAVSRRLIVGVNDHRHNGRGAKTGSPPSGAVFPTSRATNPGRGWKEKR